MKNLIRILTSLIVVAVCASCEKVVYEWEHFKPFKIIVTGMENISIPQEGYLYGTIPAAGGVVTICPDEGEETIYETTVTENGKYTQLSDYPKSENDSTPTSKTASWGVLSYVGTSRDDYYVKLEVYPNETTKERTLKIHLSSGYTFYKLELTQPAQ